MPDTKWDQFHEKDLEGRVAAADLAAATSEEIIVPQSLFKIELHPDYDKRLKSIVPKKNRPNGMC